MAAHNQTVLFSPTAPSTLIPEVDAARSFQINDWRAQLQAARSHGLKRAIYALTRQAISLRARAALSDAAIARWQPDWVAFGRGFPFEYRVRWGLKGVNVRDAVVLVQGVGTGWEIPLYAALRPARIIATDLYSFDTWSEVGAHCREQYGVPVEFHQAPLEAHSFLADGSVDVCTSHSVFEHCRDLPAVLRESRRVLRRGGRLYADFGPLWYGASGDHFCTRGGLINAYAHVALEPTAYRAFYEALRQPNEDFQSGGRYVELDLFSKLSADQYFAAFAAHGFERTGLIVFLQSLAFQFERQYPERWSELLTQLQGRADADELRLAGLVVRLNAG